MSSASTPTKSNSPKELGQRMEDLGTQTLIVKAMRKIEPGNKRGNTSACWKLDTDTLRKAAMMHISRHKSAADIHKSLGKRMESISVRALSTWLKSMRVAYRAQHDQHQSEIEAADAIAFQSGDLVAMLGITLGAIAPKFISWVKNTEMGEMSVAEQHVVLRFLETQTTAAKVQAEAKQREATTKSILLKLRDATQVAGDEKRSKLDREQAQRMVSNLISEAMGLGGAA